MATILQALTFNLASPIDATQVSIPVRNLKDSRGNAITAMIGTLLFATIEPRSNANQEIISFTGITDNGNGVVTLTGVVRNLDPRPPYATLGGLVPHSNNAECILSNNPPFYNDFIQVNSNVTITGDFRFPTPTDPSNPATKAYADSLALAGAPDANTTAKGISRLTASPDVALGNPTITIASPAVITLASHGLTVNDTVKFSTTIALPTGIVAGNTYYVISAGLTANDFRISLTQGGAAINTSGTQSGVHTVTRTTPRAVSETDPRLPTQSENDAMAGGGSLGTPSTSNKFITEAYLIDPTKNQVFSANGTWTKPSNISFVEVICIGGGGGGGGGRGGAAGTDRGAGGGGGGGSVTRAIFPASVLGATVAVTVGVGGNGGNGGTSAVGANGTAGNTSSFGTHLRAFGGGFGGGGGGATATGGGGGGSAAVGGNAGAATSTGGSPQTVAGANGIAGQGAGCPATNANGSSAEWGGGAGASGSTGGNPSFAGGSSLFAGGGGGSGGKVSSGNAADAGGAGGSSQAYTAGGGAAGGSGANGSAGTLGNGFAGTGGGGGGGNAGGTGYAGGVGGVGAGGGGGGGGLTVGGAGGAGGVGEVRVYCW